MTIDSKLANNKVLLPAAVVVMAVNLTELGLPQINADTTKQITTKTASGYTQIPKITGSVHAEQMINNVIKDNLKLFYKLLKLRQNKSQTVQ